MEIQWDKYLKIQALERKNIYIPYSTLGKVSKF